MTDHIAIGDIRPRIQYVADGAQAAFTYPFPIFAAADLQVYLGDTLQSTGFAVAGAGQSAGGSVTFAAPPAAGARITLVRALAIARTTDFQEGGAFRAKTLNDELDRQTAFIQEVGERVERAIVAAPTESAAPLVLPPPAQRANAFLAFDAAGAPMASAGAASVPVSAAMSPVVQAATTGAARALLKAFGNERLAKTAAYTVANADKAKTIACASGPWTLTFAAAAGYDADFFVCVVNESAARAVKLSPSGGTDLWLFPGQTALVLRQNTAWRILRPERWRLAAGVTVHVDAANGSNANDGLAAGAGGALATFAAARDLVCQNFDFAGQTVTIKYPDGTHTAPIAMGVAHDWVGGGQLRIDGNSATPANCVLSVANTHAIQIEGRKSGPVLLRGFKVTTMTAGSCVFLNSAAWARIETDFEFGAAGYGHAHLAGRSLLELAGSYRISGGATLHWTVDQQSVVAVMGTTTLTLTGTPSFSNQFVRAIENSYAYLPAITFAGTAIGVRYLVETNGVIRTNGAGANYFPGSVAGSTATGGQYV
ncbi:MAG: hypothetical protein U1F37_16870 [Alphaproteobacteria bacterium]